MLGAVLTFGGHLVWQALQLRTDLTTARDALEDLQEAVATDDSREFARATEQLDAATAAASDIVESRSWRAAGWLPVIGDDAAGLAALSRSLRTVSGMAVEPGRAVSREATTLLTEERIDLQAVDQIQPDLARLHEALARAQDEMAGVHLRSLLPPLRVPLSDYLAQLNSAVTAAGGGADAARLVPEMMGGEKDYLFVFENNAEVRATGGLPGAWALVHAVDGELSIVRQGSAPDFSPLNHPVLPLTEQEEGIYGTQLGTYFADANFTPDFPRVAELWSARWDQRFPAEPLDGVVSLDVVAASYVLDGTGPVSVDQYELRSDNIVQVLLSDVYAVADSVEQNQIYQRAAVAIFEAVWSPADPLKTFSGLLRAGSERRLHVHLSDPVLQRQLEGTSVAGELGGDGEAADVVDITLNDATGSKMSYYLRTRSAGRLVQGTCDAPGEVHMLVGLRQTLTARKAALLPDAVTGGGRHGTPPGSQLVLLRIYGTVGSQLRDITVAGKAVSSEPVLAGGRPVHTLVVLLRGRDEVLVSWQFEVEDGQAVRIRSTPGVAPGSREVLVEAPC